MSERWRVSSTMPELGARVRDARGRAQSLSRALVAPAEALRALVARGFRTATAPDGSRWAALADSTVERRREGRGPGPKAVPLVDTGILRNAAVGGVRVRGNAILLTVQVPYAAVHQQGTKRAGRKRNVAIPRRAYLPLTPDLRLMATGPAGQWRKRLKRDVAAYVARAGRRG